MVLFQKMLKFVVLANLFAGCSSEALQNTSNERSVKEEQPASTDNETAGKKEETDASGSDVPADVNALFLSLDCAALPGEANLGRYELMCRVVDKLGKVLLPNDFASSYSWQVDGSQMLDSNVSITESQDETGYGVKITIGKDQYVKAAVLTELNIKLDYVEKSSNKPGTVSRRLDSIYAGLANQKYVRFAIFSIKDHVNTEPVQFLDKISIKIDGEWLDLTINTTTGALELGNFPVSSNGTLADAAIFLNVLGKNNPVRPAALLTRFANDAEFNALQPLYLNFGDGKPTSITGLRYNGGLPIPSRNLAAGFPDEFQFETSADNVNWTPLKESRIKIGATEDNDNFDFVFNGSEVK
jgi:hypothetical protein